MYLRSYVVDHIFIYIDIKTRESQRQTRETLYLRHT